MISYETLYKIEEADEISALQAMHTLEKFCLNKQDCSKCPFFCPSLLPYGYEDECYLTRTDRFTPADWALGPLLTVKMDSQNN